MNSGPSCSPQTDPDRRPPIARPLWPADPGAFTSRRRTRLPSQGPGLTLRPAGQPDGTPDSLADLRLASGLPKSVPRARPELRGLHPGLPVDAAVEHRRGYVINPRRTNATTQSDTPSASVVVWSGGGFTTEWVATPQGRRPPWRRRSVERTVRRPDYRDLFDEIGVSRPSDSASRRDGGPMPPTYSTQIAGMRGARASP